MLNSQQSIMWFTLYFITRNSSSIIDVFFISERKIYLFFISEKIPNRICWILYSKTLYEFHCNVIPLDKFLSMQRFKGSHLVFILWFIFLFPFSLWYVEGDCYLGRSRDQQVQFYEEELIKKIVLGA